MAPERSERGQRGRIALIALLVAATAVIIVVTTVGHSSKPKVSTSSPIAASKTPLELRSLSPAPRAIGVEPGAPITFGFSAPLRTSSPLPRVTPSVAGRWSRPRPDELRFTPSQEFLPLTRVVISLGEGAAGPESRNGAGLGSPITSAFTIAPGSTLRLQQLLAELDYLPVAFVAQSDPSGVLSTPAASATGSSGSSTPASTSGATGSPLATSTVALDAEPSDPALIPLSPQPGAFALRFPSVPAQLAATFSPGVWGSATLGAVLAFQSEHHLALDGSAGPSVWMAILRAVAARQITSRPYDYAIVTETEPETLYIWQEGRVVLQTPINTGVAGASTPLGTWPVYLRYTSATMKGVNPDGTHYSDPGVPWVSYFHGSDAIHGFPRAGYGYPQSDGCVEVPISTSASVFPLDPYGTLVTITTGNLATELDAAAPSFISPPTTTTTSVPATTTTTTTTAPKKIRTPPTTTTVPASTTTTTVPTPTTVPPTT